MRILLTPILMMSASTVSASEYPWSVDFETGAVWQSRNEVRNPGDTGTRFSITDTVGEGPYYFYRFESFINLGDKKQLRFLIAPFRILQSGVPDKDIFFVEQNFVAGQDTKFTYKFNSYRVSYRWLYKDEPAWRFWIGGTAKIRDAEITVQQGNREAKDSNVGFVPLLNIYSNYQLHHNWHFIVDFDGLVGSQGRAIDLGIKFHYYINKQWYFGAGYRTLEGGVDNDEVYNFAWFNYALLSIGYRH